MRVRAWAAATSLCLLFFLAGPADAADALYRLTHADQDALIVGTVVEAAPGQSCTIYVDRVMSGAVSGDAITVRLISDSTWIRPGTYVAASIVRADTGAYTEKWGVFRLDGLSGDLLVMEGPLGEADRAAFGWYLRSGGEQNDFFFEGEKVFVRLPDGSVKQVYPESAEEETSPDTQPAAGPDAADGAAPAGASWLLTLSTVAGLMLIIGSGILVARGVRRRA